MVLTELAKRVIASRSSLRLSALILLTPGAALALPEGLVVQGGSISVSQPDGSSLLIQQGTDRAAGDWQNFNIGANERVTIQQPSANSVMLARVTGGVGTEIFGQLNANGGLVLLNPYGVLIGPGAVINTASFAASTLNADPAQFMQGGALELQMQPGAPQDAAVINRGRISVAQAGLASLVSPHVINDGLISASLGTIQIASGTAATLDLSGNGLVRVALDANASGTLLNNGQLKAQMVRIGAADAVDALSAAVNLDGVIEARGANDAGGTILVNTSGDIQVNGLLDASGGDNADGGTVKLLGDRVALLDQAVVDVSGGTGGGEALIGGNQLGQGPEPNASVAVITPGAKVKADARVQGDGGRVILWSDVYTGFYGKISARGGSNGGNGGFVETSSKDNLQAYGAADTAAPNGKTGLWLLDPANIVISAGSNNQISTTGSIWVPDSNVTSAVINANTLLAALYQGQNITITTTNNCTSGSCLTTAGNISFTAPLSYGTPSSATPGASLTLLADNNITFSNSITLDNTDLIIGRANNVSISTGGSVRFGSFTQQSGKGTTTWINTLTASKGDINVTTNQIDIKTGTYATAATGNVILNATNGISIIYQDQDPVLQYFGGIQSGNNITLTAGKFVVDNYATLAAGFPTVTAGGSLAVNTTSLGIQLNGEVSLESQTGSTTLNGDITRCTSPCTGSVAAGWIENAAIIQAKSAGQLTFNGAIGTNAVPLDAITIQNSDGTTFAGKVNVALNVGLVGSGSTGRITVDDTVSNKTVSFSDNVTANQLVTASKGYNVSLTGSANSFVSAVNFLNTGAVTLGDQSSDQFTFNSGIGLAGSGTGVGQLTLGGTITTGSSLFRTYSATPTTLAADTKIVTTAANVSFEGSVTGQAYTLSIDPGNSQAVAFAKDLKVKNLITTANSSSMSLTGSDNTFADLVEFKQTGNLTIGNDGSADIFLFDSGLTLNGPTLLNLGATVRTSGDAIDSTAAIILASNSSIDTTNNGGSSGNTIKIANTIDATTNGGQTLALKSGSGNITLNAAIGATTAVGSFNVDVSTPGLLTIADAANIRTAGGNVSLSAGGGITSGGDIITNGGKIDILSKLTLTDNILANSAGGAIAFSGDVTGPTKTLTTYAGNSSSVSFLGNVSLDNLITKADSFTLSLTGTSNTFNSNVSILNTGALTLGNDAGDSFNFLNGIVFSNTNPGLTLAGSFTTNGSGFNPGTATVTLAANTDINSAGGAISFGGSVTGATQTLKVDGGNGGSASFTNNLQVKDLITAANNYTISLTGGTNTFTDSVEFLNTGIITLGDAKTDTFTFTGGLSISGTAALNLAGAFTTTASGFAAGPRPVTLTDDTSITTGGGAISFGDTVTGTGKTFTIDAGNSSSASFSGGVQVKDLITAAKSYTIALTGASNTFDETTIFKNTGTVTLGSSAGSATFLFSKGVDFQGNADINIGGTINAKGQALKFGTGSPTLLSNSTLTTTAGGNASGANISLGGNLTGPTFNLTVDAGTAGAISENTINLNSLTITNAASLTIAGNATLGNLITGNKSYWIAFNGGDNKFSSGQTNQIVFDNKGTVSLGDNALDVTLFDHGFDFTSNVTGLKLGGLVHTSGDAIIAALPVTLLANTTIASTGNAAAGATISISGAINGTTTGQESLTLVSGSSTITLSGAIGNSVPIGAFTVKDTSGTLALANTADIVTDKGAVSLTAGGGITSGADISTSGAAVTIGSKFTLSDNLTISSADGAINFNAEVTDAGNSKTLTVDAGNGGTGAATFNGNISLKNLITTTNNYSVSLIGSSNTFSDLVAFKNTKSLTLGDQATDSFSFNNGLTFSNNNPAPALTLAGIFTTGGNAFNPGSAAVTLAANTSIDTSGVSSGAISFGGAITGNTGAGQTLTINAGTSSASFSGDVKVKDLITTAGSYSVSLTGGTNTFSDAVDFLNTGAITLGDSASDTFGFSGGVSFTGSAALNLAGVFTTTTSGFDGSSRPVTLAQNTSISTTGGPINFAGTVTGTSQTLSIDAGSGSSASFSNDVKVKDLITTKNSYAITLTGSTNTFAETTVFNNTGAVTLGSSAGTASFLFSKGVDFQGGANINIGGTINTEGQALKFGTGSPTLLSTSTLNTTAGGNTDGANISLGGNLSGPSFGLTINAGDKGVINENSINLNSLTITNAASLTIAGNVTLGNLITGTKAYPITFTGSVNKFSLGQSNIITFDNAGYVSLGDNQNDSFLFDNGFNLTANVTALKLGGALLTSGEAITISAPTTLLTTSSIDTTSSSVNGAAIMINNTIDGTPGGTAEDLTLTASNNSIGLSKAIGSSGQLGALTINSAGNFWTNVGATIFAESFSQLAGSGVTTINAAVNTNGATGINLSSNDIAINQTLTTTGGGTVALTQVGSGSLTLAAAADITSAGAVTLTAAGGINSAADITTIGKAVNIESNFTLTGDSTIDTTDAGSSATGGSINFKGSLGGSTKNLSLNAGSAGTINTSGADAAGLIEINNLTITNTGAASFAGNLKLNSLITTNNPYTLSLTGASNSFVQAIDFKNTGTLTLGNSVNDSFVFTGGAQFSGTAAINLAGSFATAGTAFNVDSSRAVTLAANTSIDTTNGNGSPNGADISFGNSVTGAAANLTINAGANGKTATFGGNVQINDLITTNKGYAVALKGSSNIFTAQVDFQNTGTVSLGDGVVGSDVFTFNGGLSFSKNAPINLASTIRSSADLIDLGSGAVTLAGASTVDTTNNGANTSGADINVGGSISDGSNSYTLTLNAGSGGDINASGAISINKLSIANAAPNTAAFTGNVDVDYLETFALPYAISFSGSTNSFNSAVTFLNLGKVTLGDASGSDIFLFNHGLAFNNGANSIEIGGKIRTSDDVITIGAQPITLLSSSTIDTTNNGSSTDGNTISLAGTISGSAFNLNFNAGDKGAITSSGLDGLGAITVKDLSFTDAASINIAGNITAATLITAAQPYLTLTGANNTITNAFTYNSTGALTLGNGGDVFLFKGGLTVGTAAPTSLAAIIRTNAGAVSFGTGALTLASSSQVDTTNNYTFGTGSNVTFNGTVDATSGGLNEDLTVIGGTAGNVRFMNAVGNSVALGAIEVDTGGDTRFDGTVTGVSLYTDQPGTAALYDDVTTTGTPASGGFAGVQINEWSVTLNKPTIVIDTTANKGLVVLSGSGGSIDSGVGGPNNLTIKADTGNVAFAGAIGKNSALNRVEVYTGGDTAFQSTVNAGSLLTDTPGTASLYSTITLTGVPPTGMPFADIREANVLMYGPVTINTSSGNGDVVFAGNLNSAPGTKNNLTVQAGTGAITLTGGAGNTTQLNNINLSGGTINIDGPTNAWNVNMNSSGDLNLNANVISPGYGNPGVAYGYQYFTGNIVLGAPGPITVQGNVGYINNTRVYTGESTYNGVTLKRFYNSTDAAPPTPSNTPSEPVATVPDIPNLLNNQLNENRQQNNSPFALTGSDSDVTSSTASQSQSRSWGSTESDKDGETDPDVCIKKDGCARQAS